MPANPRTGGVVQVEGETAAKFVRACDPVTLALHEGGVEWHECGTCGTLNLPVLTYTRTRIAYGTTHTLS